MKTPYPIQWLAGLLSCCLPGGYAAASNFENLYRSPGATGAGHPTSRPDNDCDSRSFQNEPVTIVLTSFHGDGYRGNTRVLFERLCDHSTLQPVWLSRNRNLVQDLKRQYGNEYACMTHSLAGIRTLNRASAVFLTHGTSDYPFMRLPRRALIIQTYHGLPTKRGEYLRPGNDGPPGFLHRKILEYRFRPITHFLSSSPLVTDLFSRRFNIPAERFLETGYPAYDRLASRTECPAIGTNAVINIINGSNDSGADGVKHIKPGIPTPSRRFAEYWPEAPPSTRLILYAPTFRRRSRTRWFPFEDRDLTALAAFLEQHRALMALRAHPNDHTDLRALLNASPRIVSGGQEIAEDAMDLLPVTDAIITDYSSIYLEGLMRDIPPIFVPYDLGTYERGCLMPYDEVTPGPKVYHQHDLLAHLKMALQKTDGRESERSRVRHRYFASQYGSTPDNDGSDADSTDRLHARSEGIFKKPESACDRVIRFLEEQLLPANS
ncbi:CDP-glycerol glycerophosphotransferase family protein [Balneolales bacterium ANBcel1]|nr:CDP-glycerol glycerophosphotransferase family protein [Balneolales bacterium ANBcel1]